MQAIHFEKLARMLEGRRVRQHEFQKKPGVKNRTTCDTSFLWLQFRLCKNIELNLPESERLLYAREVYEDSSTNRDFTFTCITSGLA